MALKAGETLLHIGTPKSGTTSIQAILGAKWRLQNLPGVLRYTTFNADHELARELDGVGIPSVIPALATLKASEGAGLISLITSERFSRFDINAVERTKALLGPNTRVVISMRSFEGYFPSMWQQTVKRGATITLDGWLRAYFEGIPYPGMRVFHEDDGFNLVTRWAEVFGAANVSVIVTSKTQPELIAEAFSGFLGIQLVNSESDDVAALVKNRSLSNFELEVLIKINKRFASEKFNQGRYDEIVLNSTRALQNYRSLSDQEKVPQLPEWAATPVAELARKYADAINGLNIEVLGNLAELTRSTPIKSAPQSSAAEAALITSEISNFYDREIAERTTVLAAETKTLSNKTQGKSTSIAKRISSFIRKLR